MALTGVLAAGVVSLIFVKMMDLKLGYALGLFAGSGTSTPTLQAAIATLGNDDPAVGYSVSYPFGVAGPILFLYIAFMVLKPKIAVPTGGGMELLEIAVRNPGALRQIARRPHERVARRRADRRAAPRRAATSRRRPISSSPKMMSSSPSRPRKEALAQAGTLLGEAAPGHIVKDRRDLDYLRVFASRPRSFGKTLGELDLPGEKAAIIIQVRRGDADIQPRPDLVIESGDRVGVLAHRGDFAAMRKFFGDSIKTTAEFSYIGIGIGMALGFLIGAIQLPLPGIGKISVGSVRRAHHGAHPRQTPPHARHELDHPALRQHRHPQPRPHALPRASRHGLRPQVRRDRHRHRLHDAGPGRRSCCVALVVPILILGLFVFRMPYDEVAGIVAGACGNPAILAYSNKLTPTDRPDIGYAMIFPGMTIVKILFVDIVPAFF